MSTTEAPENSYLHFLSFFHTIFFIFHIIVYLFMVSEPSIVANLRFLMTQWTPSFFFFFFPSDVPPS